MSENVTKLMVNLLASYVVTPSWLSAKSDKIEPLI